MLILLSSSNSKIPVLLCYSVTVLLCMVVSGWCEMTCLYKRVYDDVLVIVSAYCLLFGVYSGSGTVSTYGWWRVPRLQQHCVSQLLLFQIMFSLVLVGN